MVFINCEVIIVKCVVNKVSYSINKVYSIEMFYSNKKYGTCRVIKSKLNWDREKLLFNRKKLTGNEK